MFKCMLGKFTCIVRTKNFNGFGELSFNHVGKVTIDVWYFITRTHKKNPTITKIIINKYNKIMRSTNTINRGKFPNIRMN